MPTKFPTSPRMMTDVAAHGTSVTTKAVSSLSRVVSIILHARHPGTLQPKLSMTGMKAFLQSRSEAIAALLDRLVDLIQENPVFEKEITDAGIKANILRSTELRVGIKRGMVELIDEGWMSENEYQILNELVK